jgi:hypothetical protein
MAGRVTPGDAASTAARAGLDAFFRHRDDGPAACGAALTGWLARLRRSDDPVVTFAGLPAASVPEFADGCQVELTDGAEPLFRVSHPAGPASSPSPAGDAGPAADDTPADYPVSPDQMLCTPFRSMSRIGYPSYAGVVTHWWTGRTPSERDAVIADLTVRHLIALVDHERLMTVLARAEDRAASLAVQAISGRTINLAVGIVMHQHTLAAAEAEDLLRRYARMTGRDLHQAAASVLRSGTLPIQRHPATERPGLTTGT